MSYGTISIMGKKRKGILTAYLVLAIAVNSLTTLSYILFQDVIRRTNPTLEPWLLYSMAILACANIIFHVAVMKWRKWGFWGICGMAALAFLLNLTWKSGALAVLGLLGPVILYALLHFGKDQKAWPQLA